MGGRAMECGMVFAGDRAERGRRAVRRMEQYAKHSKMPGCRNFWLQSTQNIPGPAWEEPDFKGNATPLCCPPAPHSQHCRASLQRAKAPSPRGGVKLQGLCLAQLSWEVDKALFSPCCPQGWNVGCW